MSHSRKTSGFSLVELLVVIAIISVLAALLFPVFERTREKARQRVCMSNQRQVGIAIQMYVQDNDDKFFPDPVERPYTNYMTNYTDGGVYDCPNQAGKGSSRSPEFGFNALLFNKSLAETGDPQTSMMLADLRMDTTQANYAIYSEADIADRHNGFAVTLSVDGHSGLTPDPVILLPATPLIPSFVNTLTGTDHWVSITTPSNIAGSYKIFNINEYFPGWMLVRPGGEPTGANKGITLYPSQNKFFFTDGRDVTNISTGATVTVPLAMAPGEYAKAWQTYIPTLLYYIGANANADGVTQFIQGGGYLAVLDAADKQLAKLEFRCTNAPVAAACTTDVIFNGVVVKTEMGVGTVGSYSPYPPINKGKYWSKICDNAYRMAEDTINRQGVNIIITGTADGNCRLHMAAIAGADVWSATGTAPQVDPGADATRPAKLVIKLGNNYAPWASGEGGFALRVWHYPGDLSRQMTFGYVKE